MGEEIEIGAPLVPGERARDLARKPRGLVLRERLPQTVENPSAVQSAGIGQAYLETSRGRVEAAVAEDPARAVVAELDLLEVGRHVGEEVGRAALHGGDLSWDVADHLIEEPVEELPLSRHLVGDETKLDLAADEVRGPSNRLLQPGIAWVVRQLRSGRLRALGRPRIEVDVEAAQEGERVAHRGLGLGWDLGPKCQKSPLERPKAPSAGSQGLERGLARPALGPGGPKSFDEAKGQGSDLALHRGEERRLLQGREHVHGRALGVGPLERNARQLLMNEGSDPLLDLAGIGGPRAPVLALVSR